MTKLGVLVSAVLPLALLVGGCTNESYDTGDGRYSYLRADFGMAHAERPLSIDYFISDDSDTLHFQSPLSPMWAVTGGEYYRCLLYYNVGESASEVSPVSVSQVLVARVLPPSDTLSTDPLVFQGAWIGGGYLNVAFEVKTGQADGVDSKQIVGMTLDSISADSTAWMTMLHSQNGVPEYYSSRSYMSVPLDSIPAKEISLSVNTYNGKAVKRLELKK